MGLVYVISSTELVFLKVMQASTFFSVCVIATNDTVINKEKVWLIEVVVLEVD